MSNYGGIKEGSTDLDLRMVIELDDHFYEELPIQVGLVMRILQRLNTLKEKYPDGLAIADIPDVKEWLENAHKLLTSKLDKSAKKE